MKRHSSEVRIGNVKIGSNNPVAVQSMTNTITNDVDATVNQVLELVHAGSELVRLTVNDDAAASSIPKIKDSLLKKNCDVPLIGDFHYNGHILLQKYPDCARSLDKYRINPGNVGFEDRRDLNFKKIIDIALKHEKPIRIGVNSGSVDKSILVSLMDNNIQHNNPKSSRELLVDAMIESVLRSAKTAELYGMEKDKIVLSAKISRVPDLIRVYSILAEKCDYAIHLGLTEAGIGDKGIISSTAGLAVLLNNGIGDTIRVSLTPYPGVPRTREVDVCKLILQSLGLRKFQPMTISCPGCGRTSSSNFQILTMDVDKFLKDKTPEWKRQGKNIEDIEISVMGCIVNGPGESKSANIGISLPGNNENPSCPVFLDGKQATVLNGPNIKDQFLKIIDEYIQGRQ